MSTLTLIDSNVILDVVEADPKWASWSGNAIAMSADVGLLVINPIVYAEVAASFKSIEELNDALPSDVFARAALPYESGFLAGKAFYQYRRRGGTKTSPLPDFYIGAHAAISGFRLLTRDPRRYQSYFPTVELIAPDLS